MRDASYPLKHFLNSGLQGLLGLPHSFFSQISQPSVPCIGKPPRPDALRLQRLEIRKELCNSPAIWETWPNAKQVGDRADFTVVFSRQTFGGSSLSPHFRFSL